MYERVKEYHDVIGRLGIYISIVRVMQIISRFNLLDIIKYLGDLSTSKK